MKAVLPLTICIFLTACNAGPRVITEDDTPAPQAAPKAVSSWAYKTDGGASWACAKSVDDAAELCFRREQGQMDSFLHLSKSGNPFFCSRGRCPTKITFDGAPEQTVQGTDDENGGIRILFLPNPQKLLHEVQQAKEVRVKPPMFGLDQQFVFEVGGLNWK